MRSNYSNNLFKDYEKLVDEKDVLQKENKYLKLRVIIAEDEQRRLQNKVDSLNRLTEGNPYTSAELLNTKK